MKILIPAVISAVFIIVSAFGLTMLPSLKSEKNKILKTSGIFLLTAIAFFGFCNVFLNSFVDCESAPSAVSLVVFSLAAYFGFVGSHFISREKLKKFTFRLGVTALAVFLAESFVFNFKSISQDNEKFQADFSSAQIQTPDTVQLTDSGVVFIGDGSIVLNVSAENINALGLDFSGKDKSVVCSAEISDENLSHCFINVGQKTITADGGIAEFSFNTYQKLNEVKISLTDVNQAVTISSCIFSTALPFRFSDVRFLGLFVFIGLICAVVTFEFYKTVYNCRLWKHKLLVAAAALVCTAGVFANFQPDQRLIDYKTADITTSDPFVQMFDACQKGQVSLDITPPPELVQMEDPYDTTKRSIVGFSYAWDRAFYNGKYYSYYGIAPVLTFYYPFYLITGKLPTLNISNAFFSALSMLFLCEAILAFVKRFIKKPNLLLLILTMSAACLCSGGYFLTASSSLYTLPGAAGSCFLYLCLWAGFGACSRKKAVWKYILFAVSGISFILCVASRPTRALSALILAPLFLGIIFSKELKIKEKISSATAFLVPVIAGAAGLMAYNYARFDSPFEFGAVYQLTVSDIHANVTTLSSLPYAIIQYFFQPFEMTKSFPFFGLSTVELSGYGRYIYSASSHGAFMYPLIFAGAAILPFFLYQCRRRKGTKFIYNDDCIKRYTYGLMAVISVVLAWLDFCMGGVIFSYVCDILPVLVLLSVWVILDTHQRLSEIPSAAGKSVCIFSVISVATIFVAILELVSVYSSGTVAPYPGVISAMEDLICFWN